MTVTPATPSTWLEENQRHLVAALASVRGVLERYAAESTGVEGEQSHAEPEPDERTCAPMALDCLTTAFKLSAFERDVVLMGAGIELDGSFPALFAAAHRS